MDDESKQFLFYGLIAGGWIFILFMLFFGGLLMGDFKVWKVFVALLLSGGTTAGVFFGMKKMQG